MVFGSAFCFKQAADCEQAAQDEALPRVRERYLRSQAVWQALADQAIAVEIGRAKIAEEKRLAKMGC